LISNLVDVKYIMYVGIIKKSTVLVPLLGTGVEITLQTNLKNKFIYDN